MKIKEFLEKYGDIEIDNDKLSELVGFNIEHKNENWAPKKGERYYYIDLDGEAESCDFDETNPIDSYLYYTNNCFKTKEEAEFRARQIEVYNELKNFADGNNDEINWEDGSEKYFMYYMHGFDILHIDSTRAVAYPGQIYFSSKELVERAIVTIGEEKIKKYLFGVENEEED